PCTWRSHAGFQGDKILTNHLVRSQHFAECPCRARGLERKAMNELLTKVFDAHGGLERWRNYNKVEATIVSGGGFFALKGVLQDANPRRMTVWLHEERSSVTPYGAADQRTMRNAPFQRAERSLCDDRNAPARTSGGRLREDDVRQGALSHGPDDGAMTTEGRI